MHDDPSRFPIAVRAARSSKSSERAHAQRRSCDSTSDRPRGPSHQAIRIDRSSTSSIRQCDESEIA